MELKTEILAAIILILSIGTLGLFLAFLKKSKFDLYFSLYSFSMVVNIFLIHWEQIYPYVAPIMSVFLFLTVNTFIKMLQEIVNHDKFYRWGKKLLKINLLIIVIFILSLLDIFLSEEAYMKYIYPLISLLFMLSIILPIVLQSIWLLRNKLLNRIEIKIYLITFSIIIFFQNYSFITGQKISFLLVGIFIFTLKLTHFIKEDKSYLEHLVEERTQQLKEEKEKQTQFFINLAHDTKTPLTIINSYLDKMIQDRERPDTMVHLQRNVKRLTQNMINFLDSEKLKKGSMGYEHCRVTPFSLLLKEKKELFKNIARENQLEFNSKIEKDLYVKADPIAIERVVHNLFDNALKYTDEGYISLELKSAAKQIIFNLLDTGCGIPEEQIKHIFTPYYQLKHKRKSRQGSGMGLGIVNNIIQELDGRIEVKSEPGQGTIFILTLNQYHPREQEKMTNINLSNPEIILTSKIIPLYQPVYKEKRKTVLLVEDDRELLNSMAAFLNHYFNIKMALNGLGALAVVRELTPDFIVSDVMMDQMDGEEFYQQIQDNLELGHIPFIFITACSELDKRLRALAKGAIDYIYKPFSNAELLARLRGLEVFHKALHQAVRFELLFKMQENIDLKCQKVGITKQERNIINIILRDKDIIHSQIAREQQISIKTVYNHVNNIKNKFGVHSEKILIYLTELKKNSELD